MPTRKSRIEFLRDHVDAATRSNDRSTFDVPFRGSRPSFLKIKIKTSFPLFRVQSGRTRRAQCEYLARHPDLPQDFFRDPEDARVQKAQYAILLQKIKEKGLDEDLRDRRQHSAIVLTYDGFIVDGNRRITALREAKEEYVIAVVLPSDATATEVYDTELELQMAQDTKAPYEWVDELLQIRYGSEELKESLDHIARRMRRSGEDIKEDLGRLQLVDRYLEWLQRPGQYHEVPQKADQAFKDLSLRYHNRAVQKLTKLAKDGILYTCFGAIRTLEGYEAIRTLATQLPKSADEVVERLKAELGEDLVPARKKTKNPKGRPKSSNNDPMAQLAEKEIGETPEALSILSEAFADPEHAKKLTSTLVQIVGDLAEEQKDGKRQKKPLDLIMKAMALLDKVDVTSAGDHSAQLSTVLSRLEAKVKQLSNQLSGMRRKRSR